MFTMLGVLGTGLVVGFLTGVSGMGGILIPPIMILLLGMDTHLAMGTSMTSFLPSSVVTVTMYTRRGIIDKKTALPLSLAGVVCVFIGTELKALSSGNLLNLLLSVLVIVVGYLVLRPVLPHSQVPQTASSTKATMRLLVLGGVVGVLSGMTGAGGPVLSVPAMILMGYSPMTAIASGQAYVLLVCSAGSVGNILHDAVDLPLAALCGLGQVIGVWIGLRVAQHLCADTTKRIVAVVCILSGVSILIKTLADCM